MEPVENGKWRTYGAYNRPFQYAEMLDKEGLGVETLS